MGYTDDFNQVRYTVLDRSGKAVGPRLIQKSQIPTDTMSEEHGLVDLFRLLHPPEREYTFFSNPHISYTRSD